MEAMLRASRRDRGIFGVGGGRGCRTYARRCRGRTGLKFVRLPRSSSVQVPESTHQAKSQADRVGQTEGEERHDASSVFEGRDATKRVKRVFEKELEA